MSYSALRLKNELKRLKKYKKDELSARFFYWHLRSVFSGEVGTMIAEKLRLILLILTVKSANKAFQQNLLISKRLFFGQNDKLCNLSDDKTRHFSAGCY